MSTRILVRLIFSSSKLPVGIENVPILRIALRYYLDSVTVILTALCCVTCSHGTDCHAESPAGRVQCFKVAKIDPVSPFYPTLWLKKSNFALGKPTRSRKKGCKYLLLCVSKLEVFTKLPPAYNENS